MGKDDQIEEREVLESIFPDEIQDISDDEYRISILLDVINEDGEEAEAPKMLLKVKYPPAYPDEPPELDLLSPPNAPAYPFLSVTSDKQRLLEELSETIEENMGMAMIFTLVSTLKENAERLITDRQAAVRQEHEQKLLTAEAEENKKFHGSAVSPESFRKWREEFRREMEELRIREEEAEEAAVKTKRGGGKDVVALTGRQLWERGMVGKVEEEDDALNDEPPLVSGVEKLNVAA